MRTPSNLPIDNPAWPLILAGISYWGITDNDGNVAGTTLRCAGLATEPSYRNQKVKVLSGPAAGQTKDIVTHPAGTDTVTVAEAFTNATGAVQQILTGTSFVIISNTAGIIAALINSGLAFRGEVTAAVPAANQFTIATLAGFGDTAFVNWTAYVFWDTGGLDLPPQRESRAIATYASAAGIFTTAPFTAPVNVGDIIIILHPRIAEILGIITQTNRLAGGETVATHNHANNVNWQTVVTIDPAGLRRKVHSIWLNFVNLTQNTIYQLSYNFGGLGVYEVFDSNAAAPWTPAMDNGVLIAVNAVIGYQLRLEIQSQVLEGAPRDVPYEVYWEQME